MRDAKLRDVSSHMDKSVEAIRHEFNSVRTGKASPALLDLVKVEAYGATMPLNQLATISAPEPRLLVIQPYDPSQIGAIEKALLGSDLGAIAQQLIPGRGRKDAAQEGAQSCHVVDRVDGGRDCCISWSELRAAKLQEILARFAQPALFPA